MCELYLSTPSFGGDSPARHQELETTVSEPLSPHDPEPGGFDYHRSFIVSRALVSLAV